MAIVTPGVLGIIARKSERTQPFIERSIEQLRRLYRTHYSQAPADDIERLVQDGLNQDADLIGFSVAMNGNDLEAAIAQLEAEGCVHGEDFVATSSVDGVIDPMPEWLSVELGPPGWVPEPTTKVAPEVLAMWEKTRPQLYSLAPSPRLRCP
jgi:hypothetical protein